MNKTIIITQMVISIALMVVILMQSQGAGLSGAFGGTGGGVTRTKRGADKILYYLTIIFSILFLGLSLVNLLLA